MGQRHSCLWYHSWGGQSVGAMCQPVVDSKCQAAELHGAVHFARNKAWSVKQ